MSKDESIEKAERWVSQHGLQSPLDLKYAFKDSAEASTAGGPDVAKLWEMTAALPLKVDSGWEFLERKVSVPVSQSILPSRGDKRPMWSGVRPGHHFSKASETGTKLKAAEAALEVAQYGRAWKIGR